MTDLFKRTINRMLNPRPLHDDQQLAEALVCIEMQRATIETQQQHIRDLNARIQKLEHEGRGLRDLF